MAILALFRRPGKTPKQAQQQILGEPKPRVLWSLQNSCMAELQTYMVSETLHWCPKGTVADLRANLLGKYYSHFYDVRPVFLEQNSGISSPLVEKHEAFGMEKSIILLINMQHLFAKHLGLAQAPW